jgi:UDP-GlcNAc:undecaprenyl-phosphate GlcNAc-1-phosphate transferase
MIKMIGAFILSCVLSAFVIPWIINFSGKYRVFDTQDIYRKTHFGLVSRLGGVAIFFGYFTVLHLYSDLDSLSIHAMAAASAIVFFLGLKDDLLGGALPHEKFLVQLLAASIFVIFNGQGFKLDFLSITISNLTWLIGFLLSISFLLFVINSFNFIDGIDGLAGVLGVFINIVIGIYLLDLGDDELAMSAFVIAGSTVGFLTYNLIPGKVFMGDSGAMLIGLITGASCLRFINLSFGCDNPQFLSPILIVCTLLVVPTFDVLRIFVIRTLHRKPLLTGDRNHLHHRLQDVGLKDLHVVLVLLMFTAISLSIAILGQKMGEITISITLSLFCLIGNSILSYLRGCRLSSSYKLTDVLFIDTFNRR